MHYAMQHAIAAETLVIHICIGVVARQNMCLVALSNYTKKGH